MKNRLLSIFLLGMVSCLCSQAQEYVNLNGTYIPLSQVKSIKMEVREHEASLSRMLENNNKVSIYTAALKATGIIDSLKCYTDPNYGWASEKDRIDSCTWTNNQLCENVSIEYDNVAYPEYRKIEHTMFLCPDSILESKYGIKSLDGLRKKAKEVYDAVYPEDANVKDETDRHNSLNRFVSYHILNFTGNYYTLTAMDGDAPNGKLQYNFNRRNRDITDWYETMMPHSIMKFSFPSGTISGLYINRRGVQSRADERGVFIRGSLVTPDNVVTEEMNGVNGILHYVDDILLYDKTMQSQICDDVIRVDCTALSPDFLTRGSDGEIARGHSTLASDSKYGIGGAGPNASTNPNTCIGFKPGFVRNIEFDNDTHIHVRNRVPSFWCYEGDELSVKGKCDVNIKLPPVPAGTYEVRYFSCVNFATLGILGFYLDGVPQGMPVDFRNSGMEMMNFKSDSELASAEAIAAFDRTSHNKGWMKGPKDYEPGLRSTYASSQSMRDIYNTIRCVIGTFTTDGKSDHYLRLRQLLEGANYSINMDFIELVPKTVYDNEEYRETIY